MFLLLLLPLLGFTTASLLYNKSLDRIREKQNKLLLEANEEHSTVNWLEAAAVNCHIARKAIALLEKDEMSYSEQIKGSALARPKWMNSNSAHIPPEQSWDLFKEELDRCPDDEERIEVIACWSTTNVSDDFFTNWEKMAILGTIESKEARRRVRKIIFKKAKDLLETLESERSPVEKVAD